MKRLECQSCGASLSWDGRSPTVRCNFCGSEYLMHPRGAQRASNVGKGQVDPIALTQGFGAGTSVAQSYIPEGWHVKTQDIDHGTSLIAPAILDVSYESGDKITSLRYQTGRLYAHLDNTPQNAAAQGQLQLPEGIITWAYRDAQNVCDESAMQMAQEIPGAQQLQVLNESRSAPASLRQKVRKAQETLSKQGMLNINFDWCHRHYLCQTSAGNRHLVVEALGFNFYKPPSQQEIMAYQRVAPLLARSQMNLMGLMGMMAPAPAIEEPKPRPFWGTELVCSLVATDATVVAASEYLDKIRDSFETLPACDALRDKIAMLLMQTCQQVDNAQAQVLSQMAADQAASWDRRSQIIRDTNDYTTSVMRSMNANTAATNDRVANLRSESIRGVNSYYTNPATRGYGSPDVMEADVRYDHVWQSHDHPDHFVAAEGDWLEPGVDFEELPRTNGAY